MDTLIRADLFFFITSIAVIVLTVVLIVLAAYIVGILKDVREIIVRIRKTADIFSDDFTGFLKALKMQGMAIEKLMHSFFGKTGKIKKTKPSK